MLACGAYFLAESACTCRRRHVLQDHQRDATEQRHHANDNERRRITADCPARMLDPICVDGLQASGSRAIMHNREPRDTRKTASLCVRQYRTHATGAVRETACAASRALASVRLDERVVHLQDRLARDAATALAAECVPASGQRQHLADDRPQLTRDDAAREFDEFTALRLHDEEH